MNCILYPLDETSLDIAVCINYQVMKSTYARKIDSVIKICCQSVIKYEPSEVLYIELGALGLNLKPFTKFYTQK